MTFASRRSNLFAFCGVLICSRFAGCSDAPKAPDETASRMVYVDLKTRSPLVQPSTDEVPAVHPETGQRTLMPGLYCSSCERWHPAPAFETLQRTPGAARCPKTGTPLTLDGPWPQGDDQ